MTDHPSRLQIFSIFDTEAKAFMPPFFMPTIGMAVRAFGDDVSRSGSHLGSHPDHYALYHLGGFNDSNGDFYAFPPNERKIISRATDFIQPV